MVFHSPHLFSVPLRVEGRMFKFEVCIVSLAIISSALCQTDEIKDLTSAINGILDAIWNERESMTPDLLLGLVIAEQVLMTSRNDQLQNEINWLIMKCQKIIEDFVMYKAGNYSTKQINLILDKELWRAIAEQESKKFQISPKYYWYYKTLFEMDYNNQDNNIRDENLEYCLEEFHSKCYIPTECVINPPLLSLTANYHLTHELLFLMVATKSNCSSELQQSVSIYDIEDLKDFICAKLYYDVVKRIIKPKWIGDLDLAMEEIVLCAFEGYYYVLNQEFKNKILTYMYKGCIAPEKQKRLDTITDTGCHTHLNAVGIASLSLYLRKSLTTLPTK